MAAATSSRSRTAFIAAVAVLVAVGITAGLFLGFGAGEVGTHSVAAHHATPTHHTESPAVRPSP